MLQNRLLVLFTTLLCMSGIVRSDDVKLTHYTNTNCITDIAFHGDTAWVATTGGVMKMDKYGNQIAIYTTLDGLIDNEVTSIAVDPQGNKWFGSYSGISEFDGLSWTNKSLQNILDITIDGNGEVWFAQDYYFISDMGMSGSTWQITAGEWIAYPKSSARSIATDTSGSVWIVTETIKKIDGQNFIAIDSLLDKTAKHIAISKQGEKWVATTKGVSHFDGTKWHNFTDNSLFLHKVNSIAFDDNDNTWFASDNGLIRFDGISWNQILETDGLISNKVQSVAIAENGDVWAGTDKGLSIFDGSTWKSKSNTNCIIDNNVICTAVDRNDQMWFGTKKGISVFDGLNWTSYSTIDGVANATINALVVDTDNTIWVATNSGISKFDGTNWISYHTEDGVVGNVARTLVIDVSGNIWAGTTSGISRFDGANWASFTTNEGLNSNDIYSAEATADGSVWFGTSAGLIQYRDGSWTAFNESENKVAEISADMDGNIWQGVSINRIWQTDGVIVKYDGSTWDTVKFEIPWISQIVTGIAVDRDGKVWFGTPQEGISIYNGGVWEYIDSPYDFKANFFNDVAIDMSGVKWFTTRSGIFKLEDGGAPAFDPLEKTVTARTFNDKNGNGLFDTDEQLLPRQNLQFSGDKGLLNTWTNGEIAFFRADGYYTLNILPQNNWECTTEQSVSFTVKDGQSRTAIIYGLKMKDKKTDLKVDIAGTATRALFNTRYWLNIENRGSETGATTLSMKYDSKLTYISASTPPQTITDSTLLWEIQELGTFESLQILVDFEVAGISFLGDTITNTVTAETDAEELSESNNVMVTNQVITGSYDPNDKTESKGILKEGYTLFGKELSYTIRFQNTGTDTAFNIQIVDTLSKGINWNTFNMSSYSHPLTYAIDDNGVLTVKFENILLPDSIVNEPASHGFIKYSIMPNSGMDENTIVQNTAYIYFDRNPAIVTNTTTNTFVSKLPETLIHKPMQTGLADSELNLALQPNPATDFIIVAGVGTSFIYSITDIAGHTVLQGKATNATIDISNLTSGIYTIIINGQSEQFIK